MVDVGSSAKRENGDRAGVGATQGMCNMADNDGMKSMHDDDAVAGIAQFEEEEGEMWCLDDAGKGIDVCETDDVKASAAPFFLMHASYKGGSYHSRPLCLHLRRRLNSRLLLS